MPDQTWKKLASMAALSFCVASLALPLNTSAAESSADEIQELRAQIALLQQRLDAMEAREKASEEAAKTAAPAPAAPAAKDFTVTVGESNVAGIFSADKSRYFQIKTRLQVDSHMFTGDSDGSSDIYIRRALVSFRGKVDNVSWVVTPQLVSSPVLEDGWIDYAFDDSSLMIRAGKFPTLEGLELEQSNAKLLFIERGMPSNLSTGREIGLFLSGKALDNKVDWVVAVVDGALDGNSQNNNSNLSSDVSGVARVMVKPFAGMEDSPLEGLMIGGSVSYGQEDTSITGATDKSMSFKTSGRNTFLQIQTGTNIDGDRYRINPRLAYFYGPFELMSEYMLSSYDMNRGGVAHTIGNSAWTVQAGYVLTGEKASYGGVKPAKPFSLEDGTWGAFEVGVRYNVFNGDKDLFSGDSTEMIATSTSVQKAKAVGFSLKWYMTANLLWAVNYESTSFSGEGADREDESAIITRMQIDF